MIKYKKRRKYKYTLTEDYTYNTKIKSEMEFDSLFLRIDKEGNLLIKCGYSWDGATKFPDLNTIMRGSLVHDALYQLMREGILNQSHRDSADRILEKICNEAGMPRWLSRKVYWAVKLFGAQASNGTSLTAP